MSNEAEKQTTEVVDGDAEFERELVEETTNRLADLALALCHYDPALAKVALARALGDVSAIFQAEDDGPCIHECFAVAEEYMSDVEVKINKLPAPSESGGN